MGVLESNDIVFHCNKKHFSFVQYAYPNHIQVNFFSSSEP